MAKDIDEEVETLAELKEKYRKELAEAKEEAYNDAVEAAAIDLAVENAEIVELPEEMIHEEVHRSINEFLGNMQRQGISPEMYFQITGTTQDDLHKQYEADVYKRQWLALSTNKNTRSNPYRRVFLRDFARNGQHRTCPTG